MFQTGMLSIEVPPDFISEETSGDVTVPEGWHVRIERIRNVTCIVFKLPVCNSFESLS